MHERGLTGAIQRDVAFQEKREPVKELRRHAFDQVAIAHELLAKDPNEDHGEGYTAARNHLKAALALLEPVR